MVPHGGAYYRVSTGKQAKSGLGIEAQRHAVADYLKCANWRILQSSRRADRRSRERRVA
jgi:DNA invertase Pin-like site-specific DNA recombinase